MRLNVIILFVGISLALCALSNVGWAQANQKSNEVCKEEVRAIYKVHTANTDAKASKTVSYNYTTKVDYTAKDAPILAPIKTSVVSGAGNVIYRNSMAEMYQDQKEVIVVMHISREIYRANVANNGFKAMDPNQTLQIIDKVIEISTVVECVVESNGNKKVVLQVPSNLQGGLEVKQLTFWYDAKNKSVKRILIKYPEKHQINYVMNSFSEFNEKARLDMKSASSKIYDKNNNLLPKYSGYQVIDQRI